MVNITRITGALGADVHGIDLSKPLSDDTIELIRDALNRHEVLFFREQKEFMAPEQHIALGEQFGDLEHLTFASENADRLSYLQILDQTNPKGSEAAQFHADTTFRAEPTLAVILQARILPEVGGDTCFASMAAAFEGLSPRMQAYLDGLEAYHSLAPLTERQKNKPGVKLNKRLEDFPPTKHPVVARHAVTGRKGLFVNSIWTTHIDGVPLHESREILSFLYGHINNPEFQVRLRWNVGDVAFWDNRAVQHHAVADYNQRRLLHRVSICPRGRAKRHGEDVVVDDQP